MAGMWRIPDKSGVSRARNLLGVQVAMFALVHHRCDGDSLPEAAEHSMRMQGAVQACHRCDTVRDQSRKSLCQPNIQQQSGAGRS